MLPFIPPATDVLLIRDAWSKLGNVLHVKRRHQKTVYPAAQKNLQRKNGSRSGLPFATAGPVLPASCIICKKVEKYVIVHGKRQRAHLVQTETSSAGQLLKGAEIKQDESILLHIKDKDCVSLEVRYHTCCYRVHHLPV
uniref:Uncharacterized protein n=2 Tax=Nothobranchius pienaari TaxID=704102 RepID=A0A1A8L731_9TELE